MNNINDLQEQFENLIKQGQELLEKIKENQNADVSKKVRWIPEDGDLYYFIGMAGDIDYAHWSATTENSIDYKLYKIGNCLETKEKAQKELDRRLAEQELLNLCDWEKGKPCYEIEYNFKEKCFEGDVCSSYSCYSPYRFETKESCQKAIDTLGEEKLDLIFRLD